LQTEDETGDVGLAADADVQVLDLPSSCKREPRQLRAAAGTGRVLLVHEQCPVLPDTAVDRALGTVVAPEPVDLDLSDGAPAGR
jgi:hypothetical protein